MASLPSRAGEPDQQVAGGAPHAHLFIDYWNIVIPAREAARRYQGRRGLDWDRFPEWLVEKARVKLGLTKLTYTPARLFYSYDPRDEKKMRERDWVLGDLRDTRNFTVHQFQQRPIRKPATCSNRDCRAKIASCPQCGSEFSGNQEKGVDVALALTLAEEAWLREYDVGILVSGDGDLIRAVQNAQRWERKVVVAAVPSRASRGLLNAADEVIAIDFRATSELLI